MTTIAYPSLRLSSAKTSVLVDHVRAGFKVYTLPDLREVLAQSSYRGIYKVYLSSSGRSVGWTTTANELVIQANQPISYPMPYTYHQVRALALGDTTDKVALLVYDPSTEGRLEIWTLPFGSQPLTTQPFTILGQEELGVNPSFDVLAAHSNNSMGNQAMTGIYRYNPQERILSTLWTDTTAQAPSVSANMILNDEWVCVVTGSALLGWDRTGAKVNLPGALRDNVALSADGKYLLVYRSEKIIETNKTQYVFQLIEMASQREVRQVSHAIDQSTPVDFVLGEDLSILELRVTQDGQFQHTSWDW